MEGTTSLRKRNVGVLGVVGMVYALCAAGAYGIEDMVSSSGPGMTIIMLIVLPLIWAFPIALTSCELGSAIPEEGGYYKWVQRGLGEYWGFQVGWLKNVGMFINIATFVVLATNYIASFFGLNNLTAYIVKLVIIAVFTWVNLVGIKEVSAVNTVISFAILIAFGGIAVIGFMHMNQNPFEPVVADGMTVVGSIGSSIAIGMWMYAGYESMSALAGEIENPQVIPKGILLALPLIIATYVVPTIAAVGSVGHWSQWGSDGVSYIDVAMKYAPVFGVAFMLVAAISNISMFNGYLASGSRGFFIMADDELFPKFFTKTSKKTGIPYVSVLFLSGVSVVLCALKFDMLVTAVSLLNMGLYSLILISMMVLRKKEPDLKRPYKVRMSDGAVNVFCTIPIIVAFIALYINGTDYFVLGLIVMGTGPLVYIIFKRMYGGLHKKDPENNPINDATKLAVGDTKKIAFSFGLLGALMLIGRFFLPWYDDPQTYADTYGKPGIFDTFMNVTTAAIIVYAVLTVIFIVIGRKTNDE